MKVCHITTAHSPSSNRIFHKQIKTLVNAGYDAIFIVQNDKNEKVDGAHIIALPKAKNRIHRMLWLPWKSLVLALKQKALIYHFHDPELIVIGLILKLLKKKVIYDAHEDVPRQILSKTYAIKPLRKVVAWMAERIENFAARRFDIVVAATPFIRDRFLRVRCSSLDINNYPILSEFFISDSFWSNKEYAVCYIGAIDSYRGLFEMVDAVGRTSCNLLLAGHFASTGERARALPMPGWSHVEELGHVSRSEVKNILSRSLAGLVCYHPVPNHIDAQPTKMFEYMCAGIPVIASDFPLWKKFIEDNKCGICIDPLNPSAISEAISWIAHHCDEARNMGRNGLQSMKEKYSWESEQKKLILIYESLLSDIPIKIPFTRS